MTDAVLPMQSSDTIAHSQRSLDTSSGIDALLWMLSVAAWVALVLWVIFAGAVGEVDVRATAIARLWPLLAVWATALVLKSSTTTRQSRDLTAAQGALELAHAGALGRYPVPVSGGSA